jgi:hypothetical protein
MVFGQLSNVCFMSSLSKRNGYLPFFIYFLISLNFHISANICAIPCLSLLGHHAVYDLLHHLQFMSHYSGNKLFSKIFAEECDTVHWEGAIWEGGGRKYVQPDFAHFVSSFMFGVFGRLVTVSIVSQLMLWCFTLLSLQCQGNQQNSHTHAKPWPLGRNTNSVCVCACQTLLLATWPFHWILPHCIASLLLLWDLYIGLLFLNVIFALKMVCYKCSFELSNIFTY